MASTPTSRYKVRKQGVGDNVNTWGETLLNIVLDTFDRGSKGYQSITMTGDTTLTWSDYSSSNQGQVAVLNLAGSLSSAANLVVPSTEWAWDSIINGTGQTVTVKTSAGTGIAIPNGRRVAVYCDGTDVYSSTPNYMPTDITETNNRDLVDFGALNTAIANVSVAGGTGPVYVSATDSTLGFLRAKLTTSISGALTLQLATLNAGGNEQVQISGSVGRNALTDGGTQAAGFTPTADYSYLCNCTSAGFTVALSSMTSPSVGSTLRLTKYGTAGGLFLAGTVNGNASGLTIASADEGVVEIDYTGASRGWV